MWLGLGASIQIGQRVPDLVGLVLEPEQELILVVSSFELLLFYSLIVYIFSTSC